MAAALKPIYTAATENEELERFIAFTESDLGHRYPAIGRLWENAWAEFVPFLAFDREIRTVICTANTNRITQFPLPAGRQRPRSLPDRAGRLEVPLSDHDEPGPDRCRT